MHYDRAIKSYIWHCMRRLISFQKELDDPDSQAMKHKGGMEVHLWHTSCIIDLVFIRELARVTC